MATLNASVVFTCFTPVGYAAKDIMWTLNGTGLQELNLNNVRNDTISDGVGLLAIIGLTEKFNGTTIQCKSNISSNVVVYSEISQLSVQGMFYHWICRESYMF